MKIWTPNQHAKKPCHDNGYLQTAADVRAHRNRFQMNPWGKAGSLIVPQPLRFAGGRRRCCEEPVTPTDCGDCVDGGPAWWAMTDTSGRVAYILDDWNYGGPDTCQWHASCLTGDFEVGTSGDKLYADGYIGLNYTDSQATNGSGDIVQCIKSLDMTTGTGDWESIAPLSLAHSVWGVMSVPASMNITVSGWTNSANCSGCSAMDGLYEATKDATCGNSYTYQGAQVRDCLGYPLFWSYQFIVPYIVFSRSASTGRIIATLGFSYCTSSTEGPQCNSNNAAGIDTGDYALTPDMFPLETSVAYGTPSTRCNGTISLSAAL